MRGQRIDPNKFGLLRLPAGGYGKDMKGHWWVRPPGSDAYQLESENVQEHDDGTITVTTQINGHGIFLERGFWRKT